MDPEPSEEDKLNRCLWLTIDELDLSCRTMGCLKDADIRYVGDLVQKTEAELEAQIASRRSRSEIKNILAKMGLSLGMTIPNWEHGS